MREALAIVTAEGLPAMWERHARVQKHLWDGLSSMGLEPFVEKPEDRLLTVNTIKVRTSLCPWHAITIICLKLHAWEGAAQAAGAS